MTLQSPTTELESKPSLTPQGPYQKCCQQLSNDGKIIVSKKAWAVRISAIIGLSLAVTYNLHQGLALGDPYVIYSTLMPLQSFLIFVVGWIFYRSPAKGSVGHDLVSVIIPIYNQKSMIETVIDAIYQSTYKNIEVIAVNDGSTDGTNEILDNLAKKYPNLKVIHKKNDGKRKTVAAGFYASKGKYMVLIDSDSVVDEHAITEFMKTFNSNPEVGSVVGYAKVWNAGKNILTKCQDVWYDYAFNIQKTCESSYGNVMCCSGCLAGYRREAIADFIPYWVQAKIHNSEDRDLTSYVIAKPWAKSELAPFPQKLKESMAQYDDAEDRALTAHSLVEWKSVYVATAIVYTDVPEKFKRYYKQQKRWKKGYIRSNFFVSAFFWRKNPLVSLIFYIDFMTTFTAPVITVIVLFYDTLILQHFWLTAAFIGGSLLTGLVQGLDYKFRDPTAKNWMYKPLMNLLTSFVLSWLIFPALWNYRKNEWLTR